MFSEPEACINKMEMLWGKFISLAIHLVPAIIGQRSWVAARENEKLSTQSPPLQFQNFNCIIHCKTLGGKVVKMEHVTSIVLLTESFFLFQTSQSLPYSAAQLRGAHLWYGQLLCQSLGKRRQIMQMKNVIMWIFREKVEQ